MNPISYASKVTRPPVDRRKYIRSVLFGLVFLAIIGGVYYFWARSTSPNLGTLREGARSSFKLVVASTVHSVGIDRESKSDSYWEKAKKFLSSSTVKVRVHGCQAQWSILLDTLSENDFVLEGEKLTVWVPRPQVDETMVDVPSNPSAWQIDRGDGWLRWDGKELEEALRSAIRPKVIEDAKAKGLDPAFETQAKLKMKELVVKLLRAQGDKVPEVEVRFKH